MWCTVTWGRASASLCSTGCEVPPSGTVGVATAGTAGVAEGRRGSAGVKGESVAVFSRASRERGSSGVPTGTNGSLSSPKTHFLGIR